jgi:predicted DNA-binding protein
MSNATATTEKEARTATAIRFPQDLHDELKAAAEGYGVPLNYLIVKVMREFLEDMVPPDELRFTRPRAATG